MRWRAVLLHALSFVIGITAGIVSSHIFAPLGDLEAEMKICRHPIEIEGCEGQYLLVAKFINRDGALLRYSFIVTEEDEPEAIDWAIRKSKDAFDLISIVRMHYFDEAIAQNEKLIKEYESQ